MHPTSITEFGRLNGVSWDFPGIYIPKYMHVINEGVRMNIQTILRLPYLRIAGTVSILL
jgi:hypothetical protein